MSRYERIDPKWAIDPIEHLRLYGRSKCGRAIVVVVHDVVDGTVYVARRVRGRRVEGFRGWSLERVELVDWAEAINGMRAARLPRIEAGPMEEQR